MVGVDENDRAYERFQLIVNGPALFNAVVTALEFDIFRQLSEHPDCGLDRLQTYVGIPRHQLRVLMHALCAIELVQRDDGRYTNSPLAESLLVSDAPDAWRHILVGWREIYYPGFARMTSALRAGTNTALSDYEGTEPTLYGRLSHDPERERVLHASMSAFTLRSIDGLRSHLDLSSVGHLLDVGGGDGTTAKRLAAAWPRTKFTVFDMSSVVALAEAAEAGEEYGGRVALHPGDLFTDAFPTDVDAVLFSHVLEVFPEEQIRILLAKAFEMLPYGGRIFIYGFNVDDDETRGMLSARLSLYLNVLASGDGMAYPAADYERWLSEVGCEQVESVTDLPYEHGLTIGTKAHRGQ